MANKGIIKVFGVILCLIIAVGACFSAFAGSEIDLTKKGTISVALTDKKTEKPISDKSFKLYFVAKTYLIGNAVNYRYTEEFKNSGISLSDRYATLLPEHLAFYAERFDLPYIERATDKNGKVTFYNLESGLYLIVPEEGIASPFLVSIPEKIGNEWHYNVDASPKVEGDTDIDKEKTEISVQKKWNNEKHPNTAVVVLLKDGEEYETVVLSINNDWKHTWTDLDKGFSWVVVEKEVHAGYEASYEIIGNKTIILNSKEDEEETTSPSDVTNPDETTTFGDLTEPSGTTNPDDVTDEPTGTTAPGEEKPTESTNPAKPTKPSKPHGGEEETTKEELADTGQLNWPVPTFAALGMILFAIGWALTNIKKEDGYTAS